MTDKVLLETVMDRRKFVVWLQLMGHSRLQVRVKCEFYSVLQSLKSTGKCSGPRKFD